MAESFIFYETFAKQLDCLSDELQLKFYKAITRYGLYGEEPHFTGLELSVWIPIKTGIDNAKSRREKTTTDGKRGGRPEIPQEVKEAICEDLEAGITQKEIAEKYEIAQSTISNIKKEVFDIISIKYQKPPTNIENLNVNVNGNVDVNVNDNDIPPEVSGGDDTAPFSKPQPAHNPEPASLPERLQYTADMVPAASTERPHEIPDSTPFVPARCADSAVSPPKQKPKPKKPPLREREPVNDFELVEKAYLHHWDTLYEAGIVHTADPVINWQQVRKLLQGHFKTIPADVIAQALTQAAQDNFILAGGYSLTTILSASVLNRLINSHYKPQEAHTPRSPPKNNRYDFNQTSNKKALPF
ncbi:MAG: DUF6291 domain-containing protein [Treponema sp.]